MTHRHLDEELAELKTKLVQMASLAEDQIDKALAALVKRDSALAYRVIEQDHKVNALDVEIVKIVSGYWRYISLPQEICGW